MLDLNAIYEVVVYATGDTKTGAKMGKLQLKNTENDSLLNCILWEDTLKRIDEKLFRTGNLLRIVSGTYNPQYNNCLVSALELIKEAKLGISSNTNIDIEMGFADKDIVREEEHIAQLTRKQESLVGERTKIDAISIEPVAESVPEPVVEAVAEPEVASIAPQEVLLHPEGEHIEEMPVTKATHEIGTEHVKGLTHKEPHYINELPAAQEEK